MQGIPQPVSVLYPVDREALRALYSRLDAGDDFEALGPWSSSSLHIAGNGRHANFGVALRNGYAEPWAYGMRPRTVLADNTALVGWVTWRGALLGLTPATEAVAEQHVDAVIDELRRIVVVLDHQCRRQRWLKLVDEGIENGRLLQRVGGGRAPDLQLDGGVTGPERNRIPLVEPIADRRDVAEVDLGPVLARDHLDLADLLDRSRETEAADLLVGAGRHDVRRQIDRALADAPGDIAQREVELSQAPLADLDPDLFASAPEQIDLVDTCGKQPLPNVLGMSAERRLGEGPRDHDIADVLVRASCKLAEAPGFSAWGEAVAVGQAPVLPSIMCRR